jgi:hypothetical protein
MDFKKINENAIVFIIILSVAILYFLTFRPDYIQPNDYLMYISQAKNIVHGDINNYFNIAKSGGFFEPWGYPLLLAPVYFFFGLNITALKLLTCFFFFLTLLMIFLIFKDKLSSINTILLVLIFAFNPYFFLFKDNILADFPFLFFSLLAVFFIQKFLINNNMVINREFSFFLIGVAIFLAYFMRAPGIILIPVLILCQFIKNKSPILKEPFNYIKSNYYEFIPHITFLLCYIIVGLFLPHPSPFAHFNLATQSIGQLDYITITTNQFLKLFLNFEWYTYESIYFVGFGLLISLFVLIGFFLNYKRDYLYSIFFVLSFGLIIGYHHYEFRYFFPIFPFFMYFFIIGISKSLSINLVPLKIKKYNSIIVNCILLIIVIISIIGLIYLYTNLSSDYMYSLTKIDININR